jgi:hypothetical protein
VASLQIHLSAFVASVCVFVAFAAKHNQVFRRIKFAPLTIPNVMRVSECSSMALLTLAAAPFACGVHRFTKARMGQILGIG